MPGPQELDKMLSAQLKKDCKVIFKLRQQGILYGNEGEVIQESEFFKDNDYFAFYKQFAMFLQKQITGTFKFENYNQ